ncbi:MAG: hypothetical protein KAR32_05930 [Candidatus Omnitrophica bacterium]|nr:hypothetical protein [Candidatus Omnitrophota bacterium]MCK5259674.1 hypothetical protein [Candidatus Omnitrophota bacterium]
MKQKMIKTQVSILFIIAVVGFWPLPADADLVNINCNFTIERTGSGFTIHRDLDLQRRQTNEIIRGNDLVRAVRDFIRKTRDLLTNLKSRQADQIRGVELNRITNDNTKDIIRRNKAAQQMQKRLVRDQIRAVKARNRALNQRIRDLSRR